MLRSFFITLSKIHWMQSLITRWGFAWRAASRFVAGGTVEDAIRVVQELNQAGILATLDPLGENTRSREDAQRAADEILRALDKIQLAEARSNISIKLSQIGLVVDGQLCRANLIRILEKARQYGSFIRLDMEDSSFTDRTLGIYWEMRRRGFDNLGVVIQAYLYRSESDLRELASANAKVRLCKGAYKEPPDLAFPKKADVDANYDRLADILLDQVSQAAGAGRQAGEDGRIPPAPAIATHDPARIAHVKTELQRRGLPREAVEFQMLYGIRRDLQMGLASEGYPLRVYVPYGTHWYPYFMRRLAERPANAWFLLSNLLRK